MTEEKSEYDETMGLAHLGADFQVFVKGNVGAYLVARAEQDELAALRRLAQINPSDQDAIYKLQMDAAVPRRVIAWIAEAIQVGRNAQWQIEQAQE